MIVCSSDRGSAVLLPEGKSRHGVVLMLTVSCLMIVCCSLLTSRFLFGSKGPGAAGKPDPHPARPVWTRNAAHPRTFSVVVVLWAVWKILLRSQLFLDLIIISVSKINQSTFIYVYLCLFMLHLSNKSKCFWKIRNRISRKQNKWFKKENKNNKLKCLLKGKQ